MTALTLLPRLAQREPRATRTHATVARAIQGGAVAAALLAAALLAPAATSACPTHEILLPARSAKGPAKEVKVLLDTPFVKVASITLRNGTKLPDHAAPEPITLQALAGSGTVTVAGKATKLTAGQMMLVAPGASHEVVPDGKAELIVLIHFLKMPDAATVKAHREGHGHGKEHGTGNGKGDGKGHRHDRDNGAKAGATNGTSSEPVDCGH